MEPSGLREVDACEWVTHDWWLLISIISHLQHESTNDRVVDIKHWAPCMMHSLHWTARAPHPSCGLRRSAVK